MKLFMAVAIVFSMAGPVAAQDNETLATPNEIQLTTCKTSINGVILEVQYDREFTPFLYENYSVREKWLHGWGDECPAYITLLKMTPEFSPLERSGLCLFYDEEAGSYTHFSTGKRDAYLVCKDPRTFCQRVDGAKTGLLTTLGVGTAAGAGASAVASAAGVTAVTHSSGAVILTGAGGYVAGSLGTVGAAAVGAATAPATLIGGAIAAAGIGGAVYFCWDSAEAKAE